MTGLYIDLGPDDVVRIGDTYVTLERKSGARSRLRIVGPAEVELMRKAKLLREAAAAPLNTPRVDTGD